MKHSDFSLIPIFVAIVEEKNYSKAAKRLGISQSAVSQSVRRLREIFQDQLFIRNNHGIEPNNFALDIYPALASSIDNISHMLPDHRHFRPEKYNRQINITSLSVFGFTILPNLSALIAQKAPLATVKIEPFYRRDMTHELRSHQCDILLEADTNQYPQLSSSVLMEDTLSVLCNKDHPRLSGDEISIEQFLAEKHVTHAQIDKNDGYLSGRGYENKNILEQRKVAWQASSIIEMFPILASCDYVGLLPQKLIEKYKDIHNLKELKTPFLNVPIKVAMFWHPSRTNDPIHRWLREQCKKAAKEFV